jgi:hypothetical protein
MAKIEKIGDGGPAFARSFSAEDGRGMSLRDYFAAKAMQAMLTVGAFSPEIAKKAYQMADWMIQAREHAWPQDSRDPLT